MYEVRGYKTNKLYVIGTKAECFRLLDERFKYKPGKNDGKKITEPSVYPEPLIIMKRADTK